MTMRGEGVCFVLGDFGGFVRQSFDSEERIADLVGESC